MASVRVKILVRSILVVSLSWTGIAHAAVEHIPIGSNIALPPREARTITIEATQPTEIGWRAVQAKPCSTNCVEATDVRDGVKYSISTRLGATMKYTPSAGKITIEYKNVSDEPVTINVYRVHRTCEAEACKFFEMGQKGRWLVFKVDEFTAIETSKDESYSVISGKTITGKPFRFRAIWWTDDKKSLLVNCAPSVKRYLEKRTPKDQYSPYIISGQALGEGDRIVLHAIDTCAAKAPKFGVPDANVFR